MTDWIYFISIGLFGIGLSYIILSIKKSPITVILSKNKKQRYIVIVLWVMLSSGLFWQISYTIEKIREKQKQTLQQEKKKKAEEALKVYNLEVAREKRRKELIMASVQKYFNVHASRNMSAYDSLFVFPVKKYFTMSQATKDQLEERTKFEWNHHGTFVFNVSDKNTRIEDYTDSVLATITLNPENKVESIIAKIKYNKDLKIYHISNYRQTAESSLVLPDSMKKY